jgi:hypothetical protein
VLLLCSSLLLCSCAIQVKPVESKTRFYDDVPLNAELNNEIGDRLITTGKEYYQDALKIVESPDFKFNSMPYPYKKGDVLPLSGTTNEWFLYYIKKDSKTSSSYYKGNDYTTNYFFGIAVSKKTNSIIVPFFNSTTGSLGGLITKKISDFIVESDIYTENNCTDCYKQEFIFNGKVGTNLKFIYREYINDMARPAFNQELQYDLNESNVIGFKGLRIEVMKATNTNIRYKILSSFNKDK